MKIQTKYLPIKMDLGSLADNLVHAILQHDPNVEQANQIISDWIAMGDDHEYLYLSELNLTELPPIPQNVKYLNCALNKLTELGELPPNLRILICANNKLTHLPPLPNTLIEIHCEDNKITHFPMHFPPDLRVFNFSYNLINVMPNVPHSIEEIYAIGNPDLVCNHPACMDILTEFDIVDNPLDDNQSDIVIESDDEIEIIYD